MHTEFVKFAEEASHLEKMYDCNFLGGGVGNYSITVSQSGINGISISVRMMGSDNYKYYVSFAKVWNPNNISTQEYHEKIGDKIDETLKYIHSFLIENKYIREIGHEQICVMGGAYDRYPLAKKWAYEELEEIKKN